MKYIKYIPGIIGILFALYSGYQSFEIANAGAVNEIPQLEGDGGGGIILSSICLLAAILTYIKPLLSFPLFILATILCIVTGYFYYDNLMYVWAIGAALLAVTSYVLHRFRRKNRNKHKTVKNRVLV